MDDSKPKNKESSLEEILSKPLFGEGELPTKDMFGDEVIPGVTPLSTVITFDDFMNRIKKSGMLDFIEKIAKNK